MQYIIKVDQAQNVKKIDFLRMHLLFVTAYSIPSSYLSKFFDMNLFFLVVVSMSKFKFKLGLTGK